MDTQGPTLEQQLLVHAERQTKALQGLYNMGWAWSALVVIGLITWLLIALAR